MIIKPRRLEKLLAPEGFRLLWVSEEMQTAAYTRSSIVREINEEVIVGVCGRYRYTDAKPAAASILIDASETGQVGLNESEALPDVLPTTRRSLTPIKTDADAAAWEMRVAQLAPDRARKLAIGKGPDLLKRTTSGRRAAKQYLSRIGSSHEPEYLEHWLTQQASAEQKQEAIRLAEWPGVLRVAGENSIYQVAALAVVLFGDEVEGIPRPFWGEDPQRNAELMWRIQLVADHLVASRQRKE